MYGIKESPLENWFRAYETGCRYSLAGTIFTPPTLEELLSSYDIDISRNIGYYDIRGERELLDAIALYMGEAYDHDISHDDITLTNGGAEAIYLSLAANIRAGESVMIITPAYPQYEIVADYLGARVFQYKMNHMDGRWSLDTLGLCYELEQKRPDFLVLNFPHNPTGATLSKNEYEMIADVAESIGTKIINDSVYWSYGGHNACIKGHINIYSMSKAFSLPGLRLGWIIGGDKDRFVHIKEHVSLAVNTLSASIAVPLLQGYKAVFLNSKDILERNKILYSEWKNDFNSITGIAGFDVPFSLAGINSSLRDDELSKKLINAGLFTVPLSIFTGGKDFDGTFLRLGCGDRDSKSYCDKLSIFGEALSRLTK